MSPNPKTIQKPTTVSPRISVNNGWMGTFYVPILCACTVVTHEPYEQKICSFWGWRCLVKHGKPWLNCVCGHLLYFYIKLTRYCNYIWYILCTMDFYALEGYKRVKKRKDNPLQKSWRTSLVRVLKQGISYNLFGYVPEL